MRREPRPAGRAGFTLIELLIVIAILATLAALVAAGISRVSESQKSRVSDQTLTKLQLALDKQWKAFCDKCRDDKRTFSQRQDPNTDFGRLYAFCGGSSDPHAMDRAEALWMYMNLRRNIPHTFREATNAVTLPAAGITVPPSATFRQVSVTPVTTSIDDDLESAALLYMILSQGARGTNSATDDSTQGAQMSVTIGGAPFTVFKDGFGSPIAFRRFFQNADMNSPPYVRAGLTITDPLDPRGIIKLWPNGTNRSAARDTVFGRLVTAPNIFLTPDQPLGTATDFDGFNKMATVFSAGPDGVIDLSGNTDDAYGYRITRQGNRGD